MHPWESTSATLLRTVAARADVILTRGGREVAEEEVSGEGTSISRLSA